MWVVGLNSKLMELNPTQLNWIIEKLEAIHHSTTPWTVREKLKDFTTLLKTRAVKE